MRSISNKWCNLKIYYLKIAFVVLLFLWWGNSVYAQSVEKQISIECNNEPLASALKKLEKVSGLKILFTYDEVQNYKVTASVKGQSLQKTLQMLLKHTPFKFTVKGKFITVSLSQQLQQAVRGKSRHITGVVLDSHNEPLIGATVRVSNQGVGTLTDTNGNFILDVPYESDFVDITYIGMEPATIDIRRKTNFRILMQEDSHLLKEVIVTGYQTISKERSTASFSVVKGSDIKESAISRGSILESLEGMAPGFTVNLSADAESKYMVRGLTSINSSKEPLFVVDGVPMSSTDMEAMISAGNIQSVTILKDATAVSIWGSRAANGVVVVVTRRGSNTGGKVNVSYDGNLTYKGKEDLGYYNLMDSRTFIKNATERFETEEYQTAFPWGDIITNNYLGLPYGSYSRPVVFPHEQILYDCLNGKITKTERDKQLEQLASQDGYGSYKKELMSDNWMQSHTISVAGGSEKYNVFASFGYEENHGDYHNTDDTYKLSVNQNYDITKWLKWDLSINASYNQSKSYINSLKSEGSINMLLPYALLRNSDGSMVNFNKYNMYETYLVQAENFTGISTDYYPINDFFNSTVKTKTTRIRANTGFQLDFGAGIGYELRMQYLRDSSNGEKYMPEETWYMRNMRMQATDSDGKQYLPATGGDFTTTNSFSSDWTVRNQFTYNKNFCDMKHQITALVGCEYRESKSNGYTSFQRGYNYQTMSAAYYDITAARNLWMNFFGNYTGVDVDKNSQAETILRYVSYYGNLAYTFDEKYSINANIRVDQSNLFGTDVNDQYKPIGSVGLSWNASKEKFFSNWKWLNTLTLRLGYGFSGNSPSPDQGGPYNIIVPYTGNNMFDSGYELSSAANRKLSWEKTETWNLGIDFDVLKHRISGSLDLYNKVTSDLLADKATNPLTGITSIYANVGKLRNRGLELSLNSHNIVGADFNWYTTLNLSLNSNKVLNYYNEPTTSASTMMERHYVEGNPAGALYALRWAGLTHDTGIPQVYDKDGKVVTNSSQLTADDVHYEGTVIPKWNGSVINRFTYKNFDFSAMFIFNLGNKMRTSTFIQMNNRFSYNRLNDYDKRWRQPGDEANTDICSAYEDPDYAGRGALFGETLLPNSDKSIESASYLKLRELALTYSFPPRLCSKIYAQNIRLRLAAHDVFRIVANDKGIDPEAFNLYSGIRNAYYGTYYSFSVSANF